MVRTCTVRSKHLRELINSPCIIQHVFNCYTHNSVSPLLWGTKEPTLCQIMQRHPWSPEETARRIYPSVKCSPRVYEELEDSSTLSPNFLFLFFFKL